MKKIIFLVTMTLILGSAMAFGGETGKMPYNGITVFEESPAGSPASESKSFYNGVTVFRSGPADFENFNFSSNRVQFADCPLPKAQLSKLGAHNSLSCDSIIGACI